MRILLTGGSGMVGRNFLDHPKVDLFEVFAPSSKELNLLDITAVKNWLAEYRPDLVIHAAGRVGGIQANVKDPAGFLLDNLDMGRNIVAAANQAGISKLINLGSSCMYPKSAENPLREHMILSGDLEPTNEGYALAKIAVSRLCEYYTQQSSRCSYKTLIPCNIYGRFDSFSSEKSHLLPAIIRKIDHAKSNGLTQVEIWGDGQAKREFMYAGDLADALVQAVMRFDQLPQNMNIGLGFDHSINAYYQAVAAVLDYKGEFVHDLNRPVGMARKLVAIDKQKSWGWQAKTDLSTGIRLSYEYYLEFEKSRPC
ncbi:GDP-L-fucose synthase family protein [Sphingorhabdus lacus]|jgi:GDP-L-fucose synthase|uniref:GDP-L-fucose synthase family protein n=1 Tax=Sphingorhabdus lacus TaxID=392610 RepID=UPI0035933933